MDLKRIESLIEIAKDSTVTELSVRLGTSTIVVKKPARPAAPPRKVAKASPSAESPKAPEQLSGETVIHAPMVGIFHVMEAVNEGTHVRKGQTVGAIESMKLMNEVKSDSDGAIAEAYVEDGMPVEFGQSLFRLHKA